MNIYNDLESLMEKVSRDLDDLLGRISDVDDDILTSIADLEDVCDGTEDHEFADDIQNVIDRLKDVRKRLCWSR